MAKTLYATADWYQETKRAATLVENAVAFSDKNQLKQQARRKANWGMYRNQHDYARFYPARADYPYESNLHLPTMFYHCEGVTSLLARASLTSSPVALAMPLEDADIDSAKKYTWFLHDQLVRDVDLRDKLPKWYRGCVVEDMKVTKLGWETRDGRAGAATFDPHTGKWEAEESAGGSRGVPTWVGLDNRDVFYDAWGRDEDSARFMGDRMVWTPEQLADHVARTPGKKWQMAAIRKVIAKHNAEARTRNGEEGGTTGVGDYSGSDEKRIEDLVDHKVRESWVPGEHDCRLIEVWDYWEDAVHIMCVGPKSGMECILREPNPFKHGKKPYVVFRYVALEGEMEGIGVADVIGDLAHEKNVRRNQRMDDVTRNVNRHIFYNKVLVDGDMLAARPHGPVPVMGDVRMAVRKEPAQSTTENAYAESGIIEEEIERTTGWTNPVQGGGPERRETARGQLLRQQAATGRFDFILMCLANPLRRGLDMMHSNNRQFIPEEEQRALGEPIRVRNKERTWRFDQITFEDIDKDYQLEFTIDPSFANPALRHQSIVNWLSVILGGEEATRITDWPEVLDEGWATLGYRNDARRFIRGLSTSADRENEHFFEHGVFPPVTPDQDDDEHIESHTVAAAAGIGENFGTEEEQRQALETLRAHVIDHQRSKQRKQLNLMSGGA